MTVINPGGGGGTSTPAIAFGTAAARPAASAANANTGYFATDTNEPTFSDGSAWHPIGSLSGVGGALTVTPNLLVNGFVDAQVPGKGFFTSEAANGKQGTATLVGGTVTVSNSSVTATSRILLTSQADGGTPGFLRVSARVAGTSFTVTSSSAADTSTFAYEIFQPG